MLTFEATPPSPQLYVFSVPIVLPSPECQEWNHTTCSLLSLGSSKSIMQWRVIHVHTVLVVHPFLLRKILVCDYTTVWVIRPLKDMFNLGPFQTTVNICMQVYVSISFYFSCDCWSYGKCILNLI